jgi:polyhydroxyalkanoate synthesis repressor PhaR
MRVIKRYPNRKLYDTEAKQYITLDGIALLIRQEEQVSVVDHASGEDLTAVTLSQVIFEQEKKRSGFLPQSVLAGLIQAGGDTMSTLRRTLAAPLDMARHVDEEIEQRLQALIGRGELAAEEGRRLRDQLMARHQAQPWKMAPTEEELHQALARRGVPTRQDLQAILEQLDALAAKLEGDPPQSDQNRAGSSETSTEDQVPGTGDQKVK